MARIHPNRSSEISSNNNSSSAEREVFTVWMKSLICHGNGCTVFNSRGQVVFRVDNYQQKCSRKVFLMDSTGKTLFSIYRRKLWNFGCWEGFKWSSEGEKEKPWFKVRRDHHIHTMFKFNRRDISCRVYLEHDENYCTIIGLQGKSAFKIIDSSGKILAEAIEKQSREGIPLGKDVVELMVEPHAYAHLSLIMALVTIYGLINNTL